MVTLSGHERASSKRYGREGLTHMNYFKISIILDGKPQDAGNGELASTYCLHTNVKKEHSDLFPLE